MTYATVVFSAIILMAFTGCATITATPTSIPSAYPAPCTALPNFGIDLSRSSGVGSYSSVNAFLIVNGEELPLTPPAGGGLWGRYSYTGDVPYDGEVRFRYRIQAQRTGFGSGSSFYRLSDRYYLRPMGQVSWAGTDTINMNDSDVVEPSGRRPDRTLKLEKEITNPAYVGPISQTEQLTITNSTGATISILAPQLTDAGTGNPVPELVLSLPASLTIPNNGSITLDITYSENLDGTGGQSKQAYLHFSWTDGAVSCSFGPIWVMGSFWVNPS